MKLAKPAPEWSFAAYPPCSTDNADALLVRCTTPLGDGALVEAASRLLEEPFRLEPFRFKTRSPCMLLDSSDSGRVVLGRWFSIMLREGEYAVHTLLDRQSAGQPIRLHRLRIT